MVNAHIALNCNSNESEQVWKEKTTAPFDEMIVSWDAVRPEVGNYLLYLSVKVNKWSAWLPYASWGKPGQSSFRSSEDTNPATIFQDTLQVKNSQKATGFKVKVVAEGGASLKDFRKIHVFTNNQKEKEQPSAPGLDSIYLQVDGLSQMTIEHACRNYLCSPTATSAVIQYLTKSAVIAPEFFAQHVYDQDFDNFDNRSFNATQASSELGSSWNCYVSCLNGFPDIYRRLKKNTPVVINVRGPLKNSALPYSNAHAMAVIGYDKQKEQVICMDPAFPQNNQTHIFYDLSDLSQAWNRCKNSAYIFERA